MSHLRTIVLALALLSASCGGEDSAPVAVTPSPSPSPTGDGQYQAFSGETPVTITGYTQDAMEPFVSPDGQFLFINNSNADPARTDLFVASRQADNAYALQGPLGGANSATLDAVASMDDAARFYFISLRDYDTALETIFTGTFANGAISAPQLVQGVSANQRGRLNFDAAIAPDGNSLWFADGSFSGGALPDAAAIVLATRQGPGFVRAANSDAILARVNSAGLNYAPAISRDGLELFFTRIANPANPVPEIYRAARSAASDAFGTPQKVAAVTGYAEAPALSPDGRKLYFHKRVNGRFSIFFVQR